MTKGELAKRDMEHTYMMGYIYVSINEMLEFEFNEDSTIEYRIHRLKELKNKMADLIIKNHYPYPAKPEPALE